MFYEIHIPIITSHGQIKRNLLLEMPEERSNDLDSELDFKWFEFPMGQIV